METLVVFAAWAVGVVIVTSRMERERDALQAENLKLRAALEKIRADDLTHAEAGEYVYKSARTIAREALAEARKIG